MARAAREDGAAGRFPSALLALALAWLALLALAPPASNLFWAVDGLRSLPAATALALVAGAALLAVCAFQPRVPLAAVAGALGLALALPLREQAHLIGDTSLRLRTLAALAAGAAWDGAALARALHAQPLDVLVNVGLPLQLGRLGLAPPAAVAAVDLALFLAFFAAARRLAGGADAALRRPLALALVLAGTLQAFAGYAEAWALVLALAAWWWVALTRPLARPRDAVLSAALWLALFLAHRVALLLLVAQAWRALGPALPGDRPGARRLHLGLAALAAAGALALGAAAGGGTLGHDAADLARSVLDPRALRLTPPWDLAGLALLAAPLALLAPLAAGRAATLAHARTPGAALALAALLPLLPLVLVFPVAPHGMGAQRDWDLAALPGLIAGAAAVALLGAAPPARVRAALALALPLLALQSLGWVAVNADAAAGDRRALAIAEGRFAPPAEQRNQALVFLGYQAAGRRDFAQAARRFERAAQLLPNPRHLLFASQARLAAGDLAAARRDLAAARAFGRLPPDVERTAAEVELLLREAGAGLAPPSR